MTGAGQLIEDLARLRRAVGATHDVKRKNWGYRNRYSTSKSGEGFESMKRLVEMGFAERCSTDTSPAGGSTWISFRVTLHGCEALGLSPDQTARALEDN